jgi:hypothetical protein
MENSIRMLVFFALHLVLSSSSPFRARLVHQLVPNQNPQILDLAADLDCVLLIDNKVVGRIQADNHLSIPTDQRRHRLSAVTSEGDIWEEILEEGFVSARNILIPLKKARSERLAGEASRAALQTQVEEKRARLANITQKNTKLALNPDLIRAERQKIIEAINYYFDRYGREMGYYDSRMASASQLQQVSKLFSSLPSTTFGTAALTNTLASERAEMAGEHHQMAAKAATIRMRDLEEALKNPLRRLESSNELLLPADGNAAPTSAEGTRQSIVQASSVAPQSIERSEQTPTQQSPSLTEVIERARQNRDNLLGEYRHLEAVSAQSDEKILESQTRSTALSKLADSSRDVHLGAPDVAATDQLRQVLKDRSENSYLVIIRKIINGNMKGVLITAPNRIEYRDDEYTVKFTCDEVKRVSGGNRLTVHFKIAASTKHSDKTSLSLKAVDEGEQYLLLTDTYLACPALMEN